MTLAPAPRRLGVARWFDGTALHDGDVEMTGGVVTAVGLPGGGSGIAGPGWLDLQVNGFAGVDVLHAGEADLRRLLARLPATGVTAALATVITAPVAEMVAAVRVIDAVRSTPDPGSARLLGAHLEGPFLSPRFPGAHPPELLRGDAATLRELAALPAVQMITLAPELFGDDVLADVAGAVRAVSVGHSDVDGRRAAAAFAGGMRALTHAFNAHRLPRSRDPGPLGVALADAGAVVTVIADGVHVAAENLVLLHRAAPGRLALVTDAIVAAGLADGTYEYGSLVVQVAGDRARLGDGTLAGSVATMERCVRHAAGLWGPEAALTAATSTPARLIGRPELGRLEVGGAADVVVLDDDLRVRDTWVGGVPATGWPAAS